MVTSVSNLSIAIGVASSSFVIKVSVSRIIIGVSSCIVRFVPVIIL